MFKNSLTPFTAILLAIVFLGMSQQATAQQTTVYVDAQSSNTSAPSGANPGNGWGSDAYKFLQHGLTRATQLVPTDTNPIVVRVRGATGSGLLYYPDRDSITPNGSNPPDRTRRFELLTNVSVRGGYVGIGLNPDTLDPNTYITILSGDIDQNGPTGDNSYHVVNGANGLAVNANNRATPTA